MGRRGRIARAGQVAADVAKALVAGHGEGPVAWPAPPAAEPMDAWGLQPDHIASMRTRADGSLVIVTKGGRKLVWPQDKDVVLTRPQKDGISPKGWPGSKAEALPVIKGRVVKG